MVTRAFAKVQQAASSAVTAIRQSWRKAHRNTLGKLQVAEAMNDIQETWNTWWGKRLIGWAVVTIHHDWYSHAYYPFSRLLSCVLFISSQLYFTVWIRVSLQSAERLMLKGKTAREFCLECSQETLPQPEHSDLALTFACNLLWVEKDKLAWPRMVLSTLAGKALISAMTNPDRPVASHLPNRQLQLTLQELVTNAQDETLSQETRRFRSIKIIFEAMRLTRVCDPWVPKAAEDAMDWVLDDKSIEAFCLDSLKTQDVLHEELAISILHIAQVQHQSGSTHDKVWSASVLKQMLERGHLTEDIADGHRWLVFSSFMRFGAATALVLGPVEFLLYMLPRKNKHFIFNAETGVSTFIPLGSEICALPPQQPFHLQIAMNSMKMAAIAFAFGTAPDFTKKDSNKAITTLQKFMYIAMTAYQWVMVPVSMISTTYHFFSHMGPFKTFGDAYQCFGIVWTLGPWWFNLMMLLVKHLMLRSVMKNAEQNCSQASMKEALLADRPEELHAAEFERRKMASLWIAFRVTALPYLLVWLPYLITHILPQVLLSLVEALILVSMALLIYYMGMCGFAKDIEGFAAEADTRAGLPAMPMIMSTSIFAEMMMLQAVYTYSHGNIYSDVFTPIGIMLVIFVASCPLWCLGGGLISFCFKRICLDKDECERRLMKAWTGILFLAFIIGLLTLYAHVYFKSSVGEAILLTLTERRTSAYVDSFRAQVLSHFWAFSSFLSEST